jgi:hypothetical protein
MSSKKKQKQVSVEEYVQTYCQEKRIRERYAVYVTPDMHEKLKKVAFMFRYDHHTTLASLVDAILAHHLDAHREMLNEEYDRFHERIRRDILNFGSGRSGENDSESCHDDDSED